MTRNAHIEHLEQRALLATTQINFVDFSSTTNLVGNGFGANPITSGTRLRMTRDVVHEARSVWFGTAVPISRFRTDFSFRSNASPVSADGITFTIQNGPTTALGADGLDLGYAGINQSEAACFNMFNFANFGSNFGFASNGQTPPTNTDMSPIDLHSGHLLHATVEYDGTTLKTSVSDAANRANRFSDSKTIDLPGAIGSSTAIVGFTAATGNNRSVQDVTSWTFSGSGLPTVATAASADPSPVTGRTTQLSVLGADDGGDGNLTYTWSLVRLPSGARTPTFSANGTNGAKSITARFFKDGNYRFRCTIRNADGGTTSSDVLVRVDQSATAIRVRPHAQIIPLGTTQDYSASLLDQFNHLFRAQPDFTFSLPTGSGTIDPVSGLFTPSARGHAVIEAEAASLSGVAGATVVKAT